MLYSNGTTTSRWSVGGHGGDGGGRGSVQPHVYLSICDMVVDFLTLVALFDGMVVKYWRQMLRGTTVRKQTDPSGIHRVVVRMLYME